MDAPPPNTSSQDGALQRMRWLAELFDDRFTLPIINRRFGLDGILGLLPGIGDALTTLVSIYLAAEGWRLGMSFRHLLCMGFNVLVDSTLGAIPLIGDLFDFGWRANRKNVDLVLEHLESERADTNSARDR